LAPWSRPLSARECGRRQTALFSAIGF